MKIIHLSDPHITPPGTLLKGIDPGDNLRALHLLPPALNIVLIEGDRFICHVDAVTGAVRSGDFKKNSFI